MELVKNRLSENNVLEYQWRHSCLSRTGGAMCALKKTYASTVSPTQENNPLLQDMIHNKVFIMKFPGKLFSYGIVLF